jgi:molybdopterin-guanine dinucleotide biosynthesis protein A/nucleoside-triphosphatase THEP1
MKTVPAGFSAVNTKKKQPMVSTRNKLVLWTGEKHSGKTTRAAKLVEIARGEGFNVAGLLAPSLYRDGELLGFDAIDLQNETRAPLAKRNTDTGKTIRFTFLPEGLKLGNAALSTTAAKSADLVIVDEFGPLELDGRGWRENVDSLLASSSALILLVVRQELADAVRRVYTDFPCRNLAAIEPESIGKVIGMLRDFLPVAAGNNMIKLDKMLMIGSAGTNIGKTELACALLNKFGKNHDIVGIKVTTIKDRDGQCPRGGKGCGVCSSLEGNFCITEETNRSSGKDTSRLLAAGAGRVFWIRVLKEHLVEGITALLDAIGLEAVSICESNSLRQVVEPGLFLMARKNDSNAWKSSARDVRKYADRIVVSDGSSFDLAPDRIKLIDGKWKLVEKATAIIMAGGGSRRMGTDKSMLPIEGRPIIERTCRRLAACFEQVLISANEADKFAFLGFEVVPDKVPEQGPLMGIASALEASTNEINFVVACDIPEIETSYVRRILSEAAGSDADIIVPTTGNGRYEPLFAVYRKSALEAINKVLSSGGRKISDVFDLCKVRNVDLGASLVNLNTMAEYEEFRKSHDDEI